MDWSLGGYGFYVWSSYVVALLAIGLEVFSLVRRKKSCASQLDDNTRNEKTETKVTDSVPFAIANQK